MSPAKNSQFLFAVCQVGAEAALKDELTRLRAKMRLAFSRPGFITFKGTTENFTFDPDYEFESTFARAYGVSFENCSGPDLEVARTIAAFARSTAAKNERLRLHAWDRDRYPSGEEPQGFEHDQNAARLARLLAKDTIFLPGNVAMASELVLDVICIESTSWWIGLHRHGPAHSPYPGGRPPVTVPPDAPSRAYLKMEEGLLRAGPLLQKGDVAVEIGSAPGGASLSLLRRGLSVTGIDPAEMAVQVLQHPGFKHVKMPAAAVQPEDLPKAAQWLVLDANEPPDVSLKAAARLAAIYKDSLLGVFLTVKLGDWSKAASLPAWLERVKAMGIVRPRATHLPSNRQEVFIYGITKRATAREK